MAMPVTGVEVWQAPDRLSKAGQKPMLTAVRETVGGSRTFSPLKCEWRGRPAACRKRAGDG